MFVTYYINIIGGLGCAPKIRRPEIIYCTPRVVLKAQSHYDAGGAPVRDPDSTGLNLGSTEVNRGSTGDDRDEPGTTGASPGKYVNV
ncbi:hypothetical protein DPMN_141625 [Dreissena polymorpha]|uniref:Uncharacterized protein n=1 Tax=Dreissena polymorpha TaxID=45954 RepID=A0A9D4GA30_DREPO|nr:hypothetical protein DPMN_141625 [Dreissena polymorpha]